MLTSNTYVRKDLRAALDLTELQVCSVTESSRAALGLPYWKKAPGMTFLSTF